MTEPTHGIYEEIRRPLPGGGYIRFEYVTICKVCGAEKPEHEADCACALLETRLEEAEKDRRWLVDYARKGPWATINDYREFDRIAASVGEKP